MATATNSPNPPPLPEKRQRAESRELPRFNSQYRMQKSGLILCEYSGEVAAAMRERGITAKSCDILAGERPEFHIQGDAYSALIDAGSSLGLAGLHWPCTYFTNSGVCWIYGGKGKTVDPVRMHDMKLSAFGLCRILNTLLSNGTPFYFENPIMHHHARAEIIRLCPWFENASRCIIQPWNFGVWETKATCLWLNKLPALVPMYRTKEECRIALGLPKYIQNKKSETVLNKPVPRLHFLSPGPNRGKERSRTLPQHAAAMAAQWSAFQPTF